MSDVLGELRAAMKADGRTRYAISKESGIAQAVLSRFADGSRGLSVETAARLAEALGLRLALVKGKRTLTRRR